MSTPAGDDLFQETFLRVHQAARRYDERVPFRAWLVSLRGSVTCSPPSPRRRNDAATAATTGVRPTASATSASRCSAGGRPTRSLWPHRGDARETQADARIHVQLLAVGEGFEVRFRVRPLAGGPAMVPGAGGATVMAEVGGERVQTTRDMKTELAARDDVVARSPALATGYGGGGDWSVEGLETGLQLLLEIGALGDDVMDAKRFGPGDRQAALDAAGPFDLLVASYRLLASESERLAGVTWQTVVLDEAQATKSPDTLRLKAAVRLRAGFRMVATGTPIAC